MQRSLKKGSFLLVSLGLSACTLAATPLSLAWSPMPLAVKVAAAQDDKGGWQGQAQGPGRSIGGGSTTPGAGAPVGGTGPAAGSPPNQGQGAGPGSNNGVTSAPKGLTNKGQGLARGKSSSVGATPAGSSNSSSLGTPQSESNRGHSVDEFSREPGSRDGRRDSAGRSGSGFSANTPSGTSTTVAPSIYAIPPLPPIAPNGVVTNGVAKTAPQTPGVEDSSALQDDEDFLSATLEFLGIK